MMRSILRMCPLVWALCLASSAPAEAGFWDWIEELNGPGPSTGNGFPVMVNLFCSNAPPRQMLKGTHAGADILNRVMRVAPDAAPDSSCIYADFHWFRSPDDDPNFYPVNMRLVEIGTSTRLHKTIEIGGGFGRLSFSSRNTDVEGSPEISGGRWAINFPRLVFKPLLAVPIPGWNKNTGLGFLQFYFKHSVIVGDLDQTDFATKEGHEFYRKNQRVESVGFTVDVSSILGLWNK